MTPVSVREFFFFNSILIDSLNKLKFTSYVHLYREVV